MQGNKIFMYFGFDLKTETKMKRTIVLVTTLFAATFLSFKTFAQEDLVRVFSWYIPQNDDYSLVVDGEYQDGQLINWGWQDKTLSFWAYRNPGPNRVAVYGWYNPVARVHISVAEDEFSDDQMLKAGYTQKHLQFYALTRRGPNTMTIYRWRRVKRGAWRTIPEDYSFDSDIFLKKGYRRKTFQYFGVMRNVDAPVYDQL